MTFKKGAILFIAGLFLLIPTLLSAQQSIPTGNEIITQMHDRYADSWYNYLTFKQKTTFYKDGKVERSQDWYEALAMPQTLLIKFDSLRSGTGLLFKNGTEYFFQNGQVARKSPRVHELLVLGFGVYGQPPQTTIETLVGQGFDLSKSYERRWQGQPVYVVGASGEDDDSPQFWVAKRNLLFVRLLETNPDSGTVSDTRFNNYKKAGGGWVAAEVLFYVDDTLRMKETYSQITVHESMPDRIFEPENFGQAQW